MYRAVHHPNRISFVRDNLLSMTSPVHFLQSVSSEPGRQFCSQPPITVHAVLGGMEWPLQLQTISIRDQDLCRMEHFIFYIDINQYSTASLAVKRCTVLKNLCHYPNVSLITLSHLGNTKTSRGSSACIYM